MVRCRKMYKTHILTMIDYCIGMIVTIVIFKIYLNFCFMQWLYSKINLLFFETWLKSTYRAFVTVFSAVSAAIFHCKALTFSTHTLSITGTNLPISIWCIASVRGIFASTIVACPTRFAFAFTTVAFSISTAQFSLVSFTWEIVAFAKVTIDDLKKITDIYLYALTIQFIHFVISSLI